MFDPRSRTRGLIIAQQMVNGKPHRPRKMPRAAYPRLIEREYGRAIASLVSRKVMREAFADLLAELPALLESARRELGRTDADEGKRARALIDKARQKLTSNAAPSTMEALAQQFAEQTSTFQRVQLNRQTKAVLGADVFAGDRKIQQRIAFFTQENVSLIKDIPDAIIGKVEKTVTRALADGKPHAELAKELDEQFGYGEKRAQLIARDQIGKLNGQIAASRQQDLGVKRFIWETVKDERVRSSHADLDGETFSYDDLPIVDGERAFPGFPILCRCSATPVLDDLLEDE